MKESLQRIVENWNLLKHPFYQAWSSGKLPLEALRLYAREYGVFIGSLAAGWQALDDLETAQEEREHAELWDQFASALDTTVSEPTLPETKELLSAAEALFTNPATALGAMYAFEAQQPGTSTSKLDGLRAHYSLSPAAEPYFEIHSANWHESEKLLRLLAGLSPEEKSRALQACERMSASLWNALTAIHQKACVN